MQHRFLAGLLLAAACACPGDGNSSRTCASKTRLPGFVSPVAAPIQLRQAACGFAPRPHARLRAPLWRGPSLALASRPAAEAEENVPESQALHAADARSAGDDDGEQDGGDTFRERFGEAIPSWLLDRLEASGFVVPTPVQAEAISAIVLDERDALVQAYTGSGKTLSFLIPLFTVLEQSMRGMDKKKRRLAGVQAVVVAPTRELAMQLAKVARKLAAGCPDATLDVMAISSDARSKRQRIWLKADPPQVVVGDPESLLKLSEAGTLRAGSLRFLVVDEVDACLIEPRTKQALNRLLSRFLTSRKGTGDVEARRTVFASATVKIHQHFLQVCEKNKWLLDPVHVYVDPEIKVPPSLAHGFLPCPPDAPPRPGPAAAAAAAAAPMPAVPGMLPEVVDPWQGIEGDAESRGAALLRVLAHEEETVALVFADDKRDSFGALLATLEARLGEEWAVLALQSAMGSAQRTRVMRAFREAPAPRVLLASDVASRGLDVPDITHVVNYDLPRGWEDYCHRAGRAGRYGREGTVVNLVGEGEIFVLERYANALQVAMAEMGPDGEWLEEGREVGGASAGDDEDEDGDDDE